MRNKSKGIFEFFLNKCTLSLVFASFVTNGAVAQFWKPCIVTVQSVLKDPSGIVFTVSETACDGFGNDAATTISASNKGSEQTILVKYGPDERSRPPQIAVQEGNKIVISIDSVASLFKQVSQYGSYAIEYHIKHVEYPSAQAM
jgi:hypothetical protein